jgi:hypothetical protein
VNAARARKLVRYGAVGVTSLVTLAVAISYQFPSLTRGRRSSVEVLSEMFQVPVRTVQDPARYFAKEGGKAAVDLFIRSCDLPADAEGRLLARLHDENFDAVTVPFLHYLYELYGAPEHQDRERLAELAYDEPLPEPAGGADLSDLVRQSPVLRRHIATLLRVYDALFLQPEAEGKQEVGRILRETLEQMQASEGETAPPREKSEYEQALQDIVRDDRRLAEFSAFISDFVRQLAASWLESFVERQDRIERRLRWVEACLSDNRHYEIADFAAHRAERKLALHVAVDGLQGQLLEGLVRLSSGQADHPAARYVKELVQMHRGPEGETLQPSRYGSRLPPPLGDYIQELVAGPPPDGTEYLENFKRYFFDDAAPAVLVHVATVETPSISVRNLPIVFSGHGVAGPYGTGIPNFSYLDRPSRRGWYFYGSDSMHLQDIFANREERIPHGVPRSGAGARTLFERLWRQSTVSALSAFDAGALEKLSVEVGMAVSEMKRNFSEKAVLLRMQRRAAMERELNEHRRWLIEHRGLTNTLLGSLIWDAAELAEFRRHATFLAEHEDEGLPDYLLWYDPWPDHFAHVAGPLSDALVGPRGEYDRLDFYLGKMLQVYESVPALDGAATAADRMLVGVVSDHGLIYTPRLVSTDELLLDVLERQQGLTYHKLTADEGDLPIIRQRDALLPEEGHDAVIGSTAGGSYIIDLFGGRDPNTGKQAWANQPDYHDLRQHKLLNGQTIDFIDALLTCLDEEMDLALVREYGPASDQRGWPAEVESVVRIVSPRGEARIYRLRDPARPDGELLYRYEVLGAQDPLDLAGSVREYLLPAGGPSVEKARAFFTTAIAEGRALPDAEWQLWLSYTTRLDAIHQFSHLYDTDRAGTVNVFPVRHVGMNSLVPGRHAGEMFEEKNGTQLYRAVGLRHATIQTARNGSLPVTMYHWLVGDQAFNTAAEGERDPPARQFGYPSLLEKLHGEGGGAAP